MLIDISDHSTNIENIHTTVTEAFPADSIPIVRREQWGEYLYKPRAQSLWDKQVREAVAEIQHERTKSDLRPRFVDATSGLSVLLDTGAQVSLCPSIRSRMQSMIRPESFKLSMAAE